MLIGDGAFDLHDGLQQHGSGEAQDFAEGVSCGQGGKVWSLICL